MSSETAEAIVEVIPPPPPPPPYQQPTCERRIDEMFLSTGIPLIRSPRRLVRWPWLVLTNATFVAAILCPVYYPNYYPNQTLIWCGDLFIGWIIYNYLFYLQAIWERANCLEHVEVRPLVHRVSMTFYTLYIFYWLYYAIIQFTTHSAEPLPLQFANTLMSAAWYLFFSTIAALYYYICVKLSQRAEDIHQWLKVLKRDRSPLATFFDGHAAHHKKIKAFSRHWNFMIFLGFLLLSFHIPIDLFSVVFAKNYYDSFGLVLKLFSLGWYTARICALNDYDVHILSYIHKHRLYSIEEVKQIEAYMVHRPIGLLFYGISINRGAVIKIVILLLNLVIPTIYALISNKIFGA